MSTPIKKEIVDQLIQELGITDFAKATIREVKQVAAKAEAASGVEFVKMEMGIPGLPAAKVGVYPDIQGYPELKKQASRFVKAFINVDVNPEGCVPVTGSMQGAFASFLTCSQADKKKDTVLFIDPGFPVQKMQLQVQGVKYETFDVYDYRGEKLGPKLESYLSKGNICAIIYSNPNNPSWVCLTEDELKTIGELATRYDTIIMEDLAYFAMDFRQDLSKPFEPPYQPSVAHYTDNYMLLISGSKAFSYAGERIGVVCISNKLFHRHYPDLAARYENLPFGLVFSTRMLYALSSGTSHSAQYALAASFKANHLGHDENTIAEKFYVDSQSSYLMVEQKKNPDGTLSKPILWQVFEDSVISSDNNQDPAPIKDLRLNHSDVDLHFFSSEYPFEKYYEKIERRGGR